MEYIGKFFTIIILMLVGTLVRGYTIMVLWGWFIVTTFGFNSLRMVEAIGLSLFFSFLVIRYKSIKDKKEEGFLMSIFKGIIHTMVLSGIALLFGWIITWFW